MVDQPGAMSSPKAYILRAFYDWVIGNHCTPYIAVDTTVRGVIIPHDLTRQAEVVFNLAAKAASGLSLGQHEVIFSARFAGVLSRVTIPMAAVLGLYAQENGAGVLFLEDGSLSIIGAELEDTDLLQQAVPTPKSKSASPALKVVAINPKAAKPDDASGR